MTQTLPASRVALPRPIPAVVPLPALPDPVRPRRLRPVSPAAGLLLVVLAAQALLSLRLVWSNTAYQDEALYLWAGRLEWHWLHGTPVPPFADYFSGAPVLYPPIGAAAAAIGGLAGARILSLGFMLGATALLWATTRRLLTARAAFFACAAWAVLGSTQRLGAFATYDAMSLFLVTLAIWCAVRAGARRDCTKWLLAAAGAALLANAAKYASLIFDPVVVAMAGLVECPRPGGKKAAAGWTVVVTYLVAGGRRAAAARGSLLRARDRVDDGRQARGRAEPGAGRGHVLAVDRSGYRCGAGRRRAKPGGR
jgi:Dolichyl-phosphate-mannose-protein mannosyltransferase